MKKVLLMVITMMGLNVHAYVGGDQMYQTVSCSLNENIPDMMVGLKVFEGGIAGITQLQVNNYHWGRPTATKNYPVKKTFVQSINGSKLNLFLGNGIELKINLSKSIPQKGYDSELTVFNGSSRWSRKFVCTYLSNPAGLR